MKRLNKPLVCIIILAVMLSLFAGCGKNGGSSSEDPGSAKVETPEYVYVADFTPVDYEMKNGFGNMVSYGDKFLCSVYQVIGSNIPEGVTPQYEGQYDVYGTKLIWVGIDGSVTPVDGYVPLSVPEGEDGSAYVQNVAVSASGDIVVLESVYTQKYTGPEGVEQYSEEYWNNVESKENYYIRTLDSTGVEKSCVDVAEALSGQIDIGGDNNYFYVQSIAFDNDGNIYISSDMSVYVLDSECNFLFSVEVQNWVENITHMPDGSIALLNYAETGYALSVIDLETKSLKEGVKLPSNVYSITEGNDDYAFYYTNGSNFFGIDDVETGESTKLLNWVNCDIDTNNVNTNMVNVLDDGRVVCLSSEWDSEWTKCTNEIVVLEKKPYDSVPHKSPITYATQYLDYSARSEIIKFNRANEQYRIEVLDYSEYNTEDDYSAGLTKLTTEILAGNVPDIIDLSGMPVDQFAAKGVLEDLYPYLNSDPDIGADAIFPSVLKAMENDGKLYYSCSEFSVFTVIGASSVVGDTPGWTIDEFKQAFATMPEGCTVFDKYTTRADILNYCLALDMDSLVNWSTGECNFDSTAFKGILEFANSFPSEFDWENYEWSEEDNTDARISSGQQMLLMTNVSDFNSFQMYEALFGGDITYIGFPTEYGVGNMLQINAGYAISAGSKNKDAAWQFIRQFFTEDYQEKNVYGFPTNKAAFDKKLEEAMTPEYQKDMDGNYILDENGNKIEISQGGWGWGSVMVELYAITQEKADEILELIDNTTRSMNTDQSILDIVTEQSAPYFEGQKSADEVAKLVQSKVNIYVNEQR